MTLAAPPIERRALDATEAEFRFTNGPEVDGTFEGYLSIHGVTDTYGTRMMPGCWRAGGLDETRLYPLLDMHASDSAVRNVLGGFHAVEDERGLKITGQFAATQAGQDARTLAGMGFAPELSVGFVRLAAQEDDPDALISCRLVEGSLIIKGMAATPGAELTAVRRTEPEKRAWPPLQGSYEELGMKIHEAAKAWARDTYDIGEDDYFWVSVEGTFADSVVITVNIQRSDDSDADDVNDSFRFTWADGDDGFTLSDPQPVEVVSTVEDARITRLPAAEVARQALVARGRLALSA